MRNFNELTSQVIVDHLAFTVPLTSFQHLNRAGREATKRHKWVKLPLQKWRSAKDEKQKDELIEIYRAECEHVYFERFKQFTLQILGLCISEPRGCGLNFYKKSCKLLDKTGKHELGLIGFGGNNNTVYVQISGKGCEVVFDKISPFALHFWLSKVLTVNKLGRIDLAYDDFDGNYDTSYAEKAYSDDAFKNPKGGKNPLIDFRRPRCGDTLQGDTVYIGSRQSTVYWRIYDKALQMGLSDKIWYRNEVELKKVSVDVLQNPALAFAGLNAFASSINIEHGSPTKLSKKRASLDFAGRVRWVRQQCGRTLSDILEAFDGDIFAAFGAVCDDRGGKFYIPDTQAEILHEFINKRFNDEN